MNPFNDNEALGLKMLCFGENVYDYNLICFWVTPKFLVYTASDSGHSCHIPFEDYEGNTLDEILQKLERVGSVEQALATFQAWKGPNSHEEKVEESRQLKAFVEEAMLSFKENLKGQIRTSRLLSPEKMQRSLAGQQKKLGEVQSGA